MTYQEIKAAILLWSKDSSLEPSITTFIQLTEAKINKRMRLQEMVCRAKLINPTDGEIRYKLPVDYLGTRTIVANGNSLEYVTPERMFVDYKLPKIWIYTIVDQHFVFKGPTGSTSDIEIYYYQRIPPLNATDNTNWLSINASDIYLYGALAEAAHFQFDAPRAQMWESKFEIEIDLFSDQSDQARWSGSAMAVRAM